MAAHLAPGECMTEAERLAILRRLAELAEADADGRMVHKQAIHEATALVAPIKRRVRRLTRRAHQQRFLELRF